MRKSGNITVIENNCNKQFNNFKFLLFNTIIKTLVTNEECHELINITVIELYDFPPCGNIFKHKIPWHR